MKRIYLKIIGVDQLDLSEITDKDNATHYIDVNENEFDNVVLLINNYLPSIKLNLPFEDFGQIGES
ncbi:MAG: hypothetical protein IIA61_14265 [Candidatus Marinimicrobia bacterium]|nr:hypothetical protein [Candidatus Neomarinimicrobiota bacterium]